MKNRETHRLLPALIGAAAFLGTLGFSAASFVHALDNSKLIALLNIIPIAVSLWAAWAARRADRRDRARADKVRVAVWLRALGFVLAFGLPWLGIWRHASADGRALMDVGLERFHMHNGVWLFSLCIFGILIVWLDEPQPNRPA